jgi:hypothetical protein
MLEEVLDLSIGFIVVALPLLLLSLPGIVLFVVLPAILLLALIAPLAAIGAIIGGPPYLLARWLRRRRGGADSPSAGARRQAVPHGLSMTKRHVPSA